MVQRVSGLAFSAFSASWRSRRPVVAAAVVASVVVVGCKKTDKATDATAGGVSGPTAKPLTLALVTNNASDFWTIARASTKTAMAGPGC